MLDFGPADVLAVAADKGLQVKMLGFFWVREDIGFEDFAVKAGR